LEGFKLIRQAIGPGKASKLQPEDFQEGGKTFSRGKRPFPAGKSLLPPDRVKSGAKSLFQLPIGIPSERELAKFAQ
jgi:hypothetical protein